MAWLRAGIKSLTFLGHTSDSPHTYTSHFLCTVHLTGGYNRGKREREFAKCSRLLQKQLFYIFLTNATVWLLKLWILESESARIIWWLKRRNRTFKRRKYHWTGIHIWANSMEYQTDRQNSQVLENVGDRLEFFWVSWSRSPMMWLQNRMQLSTLVAVQQGRKPRI